MGFFDFLFGTPSKNKPFNKKGISALEQLLQGGGLQGSPLYQSGASHLQSLLSGSPEAFAAFEAPFKQQFEQQTVPGIAERFAGMGTGAGATSSSGLYNSLAQAGKELSTNLAGLRSGLQMQAAQQALPYAQAPISNIFNAARSLPGQYSQQQAQPGFLQGVSPLIGQLLQMYAGGGFGGSAGGF